eukprot:CAMPEP_0181207128 /NCGR_PEP_ID=MMETSP1096-20121128/21412_1 /TAXON_ID=156174 ORGANISM="Chrysochromulina ericina, Strain CCMP281" /NCGR_SAMPLE_ID=MMETSP1096 /ASSEMBLY_ACC=CAM_ASM_000453 /LENGTH=56 /DNA_ID=CAMNT_0023298091 /DNA_START=548 /DNA_END=715 /DNA_ORIENTATION=+
MACRAHMRCGMQKHTAHRTKAHPHHSASDPTTQLPTPPLSFRPHHSASDPTTQLPT